MNAEIAYLIVRSALRLDRNEKRIRSFHLVPLVTTAIISFLLGGCAKKQAQSPAPGFDERISVGRQALAAGKLDDALIAAMGAVGTSPNRFEGYALAGLVFQKKGDVVAAADFIDKALARAPEGKKAVLQELKRALTSHSEAGAQVAAAAAPPPSKSTQETAPPRSDPDSSAHLSAEERRQLNALKLTIEDADRAPSPAERNRFLAEFLEKSGAFISSHADRVDLWTLRAVAALELNRARDGREAARKLMDLGADKSEDAKTQRVMAMLQRKDWFTEIAPLMKPPPPDSARNISIGLPNGQQIEFIWIPTPGEFMMGEAPADGQEDKRPRVRLTKAFYLSKTPVTQAQYEALIGTNPSNFRDSGSNAPVEGVSWEDAMEYCRQATAKALRANGKNAGWEISLPTEAQWEYACRAGTDTAYYTGDSESDLSRAGWYSGNSGQRTHPVGEKVPNA